MKTEKYIKAISDHQCLKYYTYPTMMKLGRGISYLMKIQKIYKPRDTPLEFY